MRRATAPRRRRPSARSVKTHRSYTIDEASRATGACKATVRRWIKTGLPTVQGSRPALILGGDLLLFMRRAGNRQTCQPTECFCLKCRMPRNPALGMADYIPMTPGGDLTGLF